MIATYENERIETMAAEMETEPVKAKTVKREAKKTKSQNLIHVAEDVAVAIVSDGIGFITQKVASRVFRSKSV